MSWKVEVHENTGLDLPINVGNAQKKIKRVKKQFFQFDVLHCKTL